jgi:hypothetical protein
MHHKSREGSEGEHVIYFQMAGNSGRYACAVKVSSPTRAQAEIIYRENSTKIHQMAREAISLGSHDKPQLGLTFPTNR